MKEMLERILEKLDKLGYDQAEMKVHLAEMRKDINQNMKDLQENAEDIAHHIVRTDLLEERVDILEEPGKVKKYFWQICIALGGIVAFIYYVLEIFRGLKWI